jgi:molybdate transport system ATP-binding protein
VADASLTLDVERRYQRGPTIRAALELALEPPPVLVLFGPSGAGKTTILRCAAGLERPDAGRISLGDTTWFDASNDTDLPPQRRAVGYLPQGLALFPHLDVRANIAYGLGASGRGSRVERAVRVGELVRLLRLDGLEHRRPQELSGGQQQRVALARALARRPQLLLLDEPLSALDAPMRESLRGDLREALVAAAVPAIVITHDRTEALVLGDRVAVMVDGEVHQEGPTLDVFDRPANETVARVVGIETVQPATVLEAADGLLRLRIGEAILTALGSGPVGATVLVSIRAEDVIVARTGHADASARNTLTGRVTAIEPVGALTRVRMDCGFPLVAAITRPAVSELGLEPGSEAVALIKAPAVHVIG